MKTHFLIGAITLLLFSSLHAQDRQWGLQVNNSLMYQNEPGEAILLAGFSPSIQLYTSSGYRHQFEWTTLRFSNADTREAMSFLLSNAWRYELDIPLVNTEKPTRFFLGTSFQLGQDFFNHQPYLANEFPTSFQRASLDFALVPALTRDIGRGFYLEVALPVKIGDASWERNVANNPAIPLQQQRTQTINLNLGPLQVPPLRFGLGLRI
jgi:hypothetical protein